VNTRFGFVSTYPPTLCGLATFTAALRHELVGAGSGGPVVRLVESLQPAGPREVSAQLVAGDAPSLARAAALLNEGDIAIVQHEYGVYGGTDGDEVLDLLGALAVPSLVVLHTVLTAPTAHQRQVLEQVVRLAGAVVTMTAAARDRLAAHHDVDMAKVSVIPHGAPVVPRGQVPAPRSARPTVLTWGLIGRGKGIEWGIEAFASLTDLAPQPRYLVAGRTHPKVLLHEGERYRSSLQAQVDRLRLESVVTLDGTYRSTPALAELVATADLVLLPYDSTEQVTSGVLIEAVAAGKPVIATRFPHAVELLDDGAGMLVPHRDPAAIAAALRTLLTQREVAAGMARAAAATAPSLLWPAVGARYRELAAALVRARVAA
jgi:glycosyltransferase involved in cell wall biosynthesis